MTEPDVAGRRCGHKPRRLRLAQHGGDLRILPDILEQQAVHAAQQTRNLPRRCEPEIRVGARFQQNVAILDCVGREGSQIDSITDQRPDQSHGRVCTSWAAPHQHAQGLAARRTDGVPGTALPFESHEDVLNAGAVIQVIPRRPERIQLLRPRQDFDLQVRRRAEAACAVHVQILIARSCEPPGKHLSPFPNEPRHPAQRVRLNIEMHPWIGDGSSRNLT